MSAVNQSSALAPQNGGVAFAATTYTTIYYTVHWVNRAAMPALEFAIVAV